MLAFLRCKILPTQTVSLNDSNTCVSIPNCTLIWWLTVWNKAYQRQVLHSLTWTKHLSFTYKNKKKRFLFDSSIWTFILNQWSRFNACLQLVIHIRPLLPEQLFSEKKNQFRRIRVSTVRSVDGWYIQMR